MLWGPKSLKTYIYQTLAHMWPRKEKLCWEAISLVIYSIRLDSRNGMSDASTYAWSGPGRSLVTETRFRPRIQKMKMLRAEGRDTGYQHYPALQPSWLIQVEARQPSCYSGYDRSLWEHGAVHATEVRPPCSLDYMMSPDRQVQRIVSAATKQKFVWKGEEEAPAAQEGAM